MRSNNLFHQSNKEIKNEKTKTVTEVEMYGASRPVFPVILGEELNLTLTVGQISVPM